MDIGMNKSFFKVFSKVAGFFTPFHALKRTKRLEKLLFTSIPKCGTHLLLRYPNIVGFEGGLFKKRSASNELLTHVSNLKRGQYCAFHYYWTENLSKIINNRGIRVVFLYRDPRAQICSNLHWVMKRKDHLLHVLFAQHLKTNEERMIRLIKGVPPDELSLIPARADRQGIEGPGIKCRYNAYTRWLEESHCYAVRYEDLVGPKGGGSSEKQLQVVRELIAFTGTPKGQLTSEEVAASLFDERANTFREGQIDSWRKDFTPELHNLFLQEAGGLLTQLGYAP